MNYVLTLPLESIPFSEHPRHLPELAELGYTDLWTSETGGYDAFSPLVMAAAITPQMHLGTAIVPTFTRGPAVLAMHAAALADASPGRVALGIGGSSPTAVEDWNDRSFDHPYAHVRDTLQFLRRALAGELIDELSVHGAPDACRAHIQRFVDAGVTTPVLQVVPFGDDPLDSVRAVAPVRFIA